jgi:hypothetical protein
MTRIRVRRRLAFLGAITLSLAALNLGVGAQDSPSSAPQDRLLQPDSIGSPGVELLLPSQIAGDVTAWRIFMMSRVPLGFEGAPETPAPPRQLARVDLAGATVREALDVLIRADPRYFWQPTNGVVVVRPLLASANPNNLLN